MLTKIDYLDHTWNPLAMRCTRVSPACDNCWHLRMAKRKVGNPKLSDQERQASAGLTPPVLMPDRIGEPLRLKKSQRIGVQFMGDLFHEAVGDLDIYQIFDVMARCQNHTFVCLTKRSERMLDFCQRLRFICTKDLAHLNEPGVSYNPNGPVSDPRPLPNVWLGVTMESQNYENRVVDLLQTPAAIRFVSVEPGLGLVDLTQYLPYEIPKGPWPDAEVDEVDGLDWVICGGETGPHARPMHPDIPRKLRDDCQTAGVPFFFKAWGEWAPQSLLSKEDNQAFWNRPGPKHWGTIDINGNFFPETSPWNGNEGAASRDGLFEYSMLRVGKKAAGRLLDGRTWEEIPNVA